MAGTISAALARVRRDPVEHLVDSRRFEQLCRQGGHVWRRRVFSPAVTLQLFLLQVLHGNVAITALRQFSGTGFAAASYCQARARLPLAALQRLLAGQCQRSAALAAAPRREDGSPGRVYVVDATGCTLADTPALRDRFGVPAPEQAGVSYPMAMVMGLLDLASGLFVRAAVFPIFCHDQRGVAAVHPSLQPGDILVGDRAFCSFAQVALLVRRGVHCCLRVQHRSRRVERLGVVQWGKPRRCPPWMSRRQYDRLPWEITVRLVRYRTDDGVPGCRSRGGVLVSTLLDRTRWSDAAVADLYRQRWQIETCLAHLKTTMKMDTLKCRSVDGVLKEMVVYLIVYNLVRLVMLRWARISSRDPRRVSFIDALRLLCMRALGRNGVTRLILNPDRRGRRQLRVRRRRPKHFPLLAHPRPEQPDINYYRRRR